MFAATLAWPRCAAPAGEPPRLPRSRPQISPSLACAELARQIPGDASAGRGGAPPRPGRSGLRRHASSRKADGRCCVSHPGRWHACRNIYSPTACARKEGAEHWATLVDSPPSFRPRLLFGSRAPLVLHVVRATGEKVASSGPVACASASASRGECTCLRKTRRSEL